ncbi:MAG: Tim44/TimA family putative adaptor protein [Pseudomonadota bacterium]
MSSDMLELVLLFAVAAVVLYRLKMVIGTRTGHEAPPEYLRREQDAAQDAAQGSTPDAQDADYSETATEYEGETGPFADQMSAIRAVEPGFDIDEFLGGARGAYEMILMAYEEGDRDTLRSLLAPDVYQAFEGGIDAREAAALRVEARFIGVREAKVEEIEFDPDSNIADVSIRFTGELITAVRDAENRVVEGDPNEIRRQSDLWTFSREMGASDPNWLLTGTGD